MSRLPIKLVRDLLEKEYQQQKRRIENLYKNSPEEASGSGEVLGPLKAVKTNKNRCLVFKYEGFFSRYRQGDRIDVVIYSHQNKSYEKIKEDVIIVAIEFPEYGIIEVTTSIKKDLNKFSPNEEYYFFTSFFSSNKTISEKIKRSADGVSHSSFRQFRSIRVPDEIKEPLNNSQISALEQLAYKGLDGRVQGPPGTGKTHLLKAIVKLALKQNLTIGITGSTHATVDNAFSRVISENPDAGIRIGSTWKIKKDLYENFEKINTVERFSLLGLENKYSIYAATLHLWSLSFIKTRPDLLIVDEAGQAPIYFEPFLRKIGDRVIMLGDQKQLPPVLSVDIKDLPTKDVFSRSLKDVPMLELQYRMNSDIQSWSSAKFYNNRLKPHESVAERDIVSNHSLNNDLIGNSRVTLHTHSGKSSGYANEKEASQVTDLIYELHEKADIPLNKIGVVTPYRMQAGAVCAQIQSKYGVRDMGKVLVDTVERFQGQEKEIIILSFGMDSDSSNRPFLGDGRRLNVSVTRSKSRFYCFGSENLKNQKNVKPSQTSYLKDFIGWCDYMTKKSA